MSDTPLQQAKTATELGYEPDKVADIDSALPPGSSRFAVPHFLSFSSIINSVSRVYKYTFDEASRHSRENSSAMLKDPVIRDALRAIKVPVAQLSWHIEVDDENDPIEADIQEECTTFINKIPNFQSMKMNALEAIWIGRSGIQLVYKWDYSEGKKQLQVRDFIPINGDKIVFDFGGNAGILVHGTYSGSTVPTDRGKAHMFSPEERESIILHKNESRDADFYEPELAGAIHGVGLRDEIYWFWFLKVKVLEWLMDYLERVGAGGFTIYYYDAGNPNSLSEVKKAAEEQFRNNTILFPRNRDNAKDSGAGVQRIEASNAGAGLLQELVSNYFDNQIRAFIMGLKVEDEQGMTIGTGNSEFKADRLSRIVKYYAVALEETLTTQLIRVKVKYSHPGYEEKVRFKFDVDRPDIKQIMEAAKMAFEMGMELDGDDLRDKLGLPKPEKGHTILAKMAPMGAAATGSVPQGVPLAGQPGPEQQGPPDVQNVL